MPNPDENQIDFSNLAPAENVDIPIEGEGNPENTPLEELPSDPVDPVSPEYFLGEMTQEEVLEEINQNRALRDKLQNMESRVFGTMGGLQDNVKKLQESRPTQVKFNPESLKRVAELDESLAKALAEDFQEALQVYQMDENVLSPYLSKTQNDIQGQFASTIIDVMHDDIDEFIPDDWDAPEGQRQKDYKTWFANQNWATQKALSERDPVGAVRALNSFKGWEKKQIEERNVAVAKKQKRLEGGQRPAASGKAQGGAKVYRTAEEAFNAAIEEN